MADTMQFDLVAPERMLVSTQVTEVQIPGSEGDFTAMVGHAPVIANLRPGVIKVLANGQITEFAVTGGFAEITADGVTVMAERSLPRGEVTAAVMQDWVAEAEKVHAEAHHSLVDDAAKLLSDLVSMRGYIGLD